MAFRDKYEDAYGRNHTFVLFFTLSRAGEIGISIEKKTRLTISS